MLIDFIIAPELWVRSQSQFSGVLMYKNDQNFNRWNFLSVLMHKIDQNCVI
jgi:phage pi2 protein 07